MVNIELDTDVAIFQDFQRQWRERTLTNDHPVIVKTTKWTRILTYRYGCLDRADDYKQEALLRLVNSSFRGEARLDTYILSIVQRLNIADWQQGGGQRRGSWPMVDVKDEASQELFDKVVQRLSEDKLMAELLTTQSELKRTIMQIVVRAERQVGRRRLAEIASRMLGRNVTRHEVEVVFSQLREVVQRYPGYRKAKAG